MPQALNGDTNVLPDGFPQDLYRRGEERLLEAIPSSIADYLSRLAEQSDLEGSEGLRVGLRTLRTMEAYYEFSVSDARAWMRSNSELLSAYAARHNLRSHDHSTHGHGLTATLYLNSKERLVIYAKTDGRVRVEVRFNSPPANIVRQRSADSAIAFRRIVAAAQGTGCRACE